MGTSKMINKLEEFFDLSESKQRKKTDKLLKIIAKLEEKRAKLELKILREGKIDIHSSRYDELNKELSVIKKLIDKAIKKKNALDDAL